MGRKCEAKFTAPSRHPCQKPISNGSHASQRLAKGGTIADSAPIKSEWYYGDGMGTSPGEAQGGEG